MVNIDVSERLMKLWEPKHNCHWPNPIFNDVLKEFTYVRLEIHRKRRLVKNGATIPDLYALFNRATMLRHRLKYLAPCSDCIAQYNPTGRKSGRIWNPNRQRAFKEALR